MLRLLIVGCPHSGTRFIAQTLTRAGLPCGHEQVFTLDGVKSHRLSAEASWIAAHYLGSSAVPRDVVVAHQIREPLAWLNSWLRTTNAHAAWRFLDIMWPSIGWPTFGIDRERDPVRTAMRLWVRMNQRCETFARIGYSIEAVDADPEHGVIRQLGMLADVDLDRDRIAAAITAITAVERNHHRGDPSYVPLTWGSLPAGPERDEFAGLARVYGYDVL